LKPDGFFDRRFEQIGPAKAIAATFYSIGR
jgi:hypothetical protein